MSIWIKVYCQDSVASITPEDLSAGIAKRIRLLTYLFAPEEEEDPDEVLERLRIENHGKAEGFHVFQISYRKHSSQFIRVERWAGITAVEEAHESLDMLTDEPGEAVESIRSMLKHSTESIGFELKVRDANSMGWPVSIAAAAWLAERSQGVIYAEGSGWMVPSPREVEFLLREG